MKTTNAHIIGAIKAVMLAHIEKKDGATLVQAAQALIMEDNKYLDGISSDDDKMRVCNLIEAAGIELKLAINRDMVGRDNETL